MGAWEHGSMGRGAMGAWGGEHGSMGAWEHGSMGRGAMGAWRGEHGSMGAWAWEQGSMGAWGGEHGSMGRGAWEHGEGSMGAWEHGEGSMGAWGGEHGSTGLVAACVHTLVLALNRETGSLPRRVAGLSSGIVPSGVVPPGVASACCVARGWQGLASRHGRRAVQRATRSTCTRLSTDCGTRD